MVRAKRLLTVILTWLLTFVDGSIQLSAETEVINSTEDTTVFCCARGYSYLIDTDRCLIDEMTPRALHFEKFIRKHHLPLHLYAICESGELRMEQLSVDLGDVPNGLIHLANIGKNNTKNYCLYRKPNATIYWSLKCWLISKERVRLNIWISACMGFATTFVLAALIVYIVLPELKNFRGRIVRSFLISYLGCIILLTAVPLNTLIGYGRRIPDSIRIVYGNIDYHSQSSMSSTDS